MAVTKGARMDATTIKRPDKLKENPKVLSAPVIQQPLYQCAASVTVLAFEPIATIDVDVNGSVTSTPGGFPFPDGVTIPLPAKLVAGQKVRARQKVIGGATSPWTPIIVVGDHTKDFPAGPPRPEINPAPVYKCGVRTGVGNLLPGGHVWITANGATVGDVDGCSAQQGINISPPYGLGQKVRAWFELCKDPSPPSVELISQPPPAPLPAPTVDPIYAGGQSVTVRNIVNGAKVTLVRGGANQGTWPCWGGSLTINGLASFTSGETFSATQQMCPGDPGSPPGTGVVQPCGNLPAPQIGPVQGGDTSIVVTACQPDAIIKVFVNGVHAGSSGPPVVNLNVTLKKGDTIVVVQDLKGCKSQSALQVTVLCVDPPVSDNPSSLDLFPVGWTEYKKGKTKGSVYYPADADGKDTPFNKRVAKLGRVPIVFIAHGNHDPADPSYLGYDYFQWDLAKMGIIAVSIDCNALNGPGGGVQNIVDRADLIISNIALFQTFDADAASIFFQKIDFARTGLMGHSRGGDAVTVVPTGIRLPGVTLKSVLALAPTNFRYWAGMTTVKPNGYAFMTILPAGDGDVRDNNGAQFYDQATPDPLKSQLYVHYKNHNFFNRKWLNDDSLAYPQPAVSTRDEHERVLTTYGCALFRATLLNHGTTGNLSGDVLPARVMTQNVFRAFERSKALTVDNFDDGNTIATNSLGEPNTQTGGINAGEFTFDRPPVRGTFNASFYGLTIGMVADPNKSGGIFRSQLKGSVDMRKREVWIRCAEVTDGNTVAPSATGFQLGVESSGGARAWVDCDDVGGLPMPYPRNPGMIKTMLSTLRFRGTCFEGKEFDPKKVVAVLIKCDRPKPRAVRLRRPANLLIRDQRHASRPDPSHPGRAGSQLGASRNHGRQNPISKIQAEGARELRASDGRGRKRDGDRRFA
jgi:hypothetical protein